MQFSLWGHKPSLWYLLSLSKNISSHFMSWNGHKDNKEGGGGGVVYSSFLLIIISFYSFSFLFQFLDSPSQKFTMSDFHQEVTFKLYFTSTSMFLGANCLSICLSVYFGV